MASTREGVNPLRPYYIPPRIGEQAEALPRANPFPDTTASVATSTKYASKARDMFPDIDYKEHLDELSPSTIQLVKQTIDELLWKYTSVLMAQPFEVAKTILQVRSQDDLGGLNAPPVDLIRPRPSTPSPRRPAYDEFPDSDSDPDEPAYFTSSTTTIPHTPTSSTRSRRRRESSPPSETTPKTNTKDPLPPHQIALRRPDSILDAISQIWSKESVWGVWKGTNATFLYSILQSLLENWGRSLLSALFNVPDLGLRDDVDRLVGIASPYPWASLCVAAAAAVTTGLMLAPLDLVRTRLIVTSTTRGPRRTLATLRSLPSWVCHPTLILPTILHSLIHPFITLSTPLALRSQFLIDRDLSPLTFSVVKFLTSCASLFVKLPLETVLRRGQMAVLTDPAYLQALDKMGKMETIVEPGPYHGVAGTMYAIVSEEGSRAITVPPPKASTRARRVRAKTNEITYKRGQGLEGLWRGWKVSWWGLVGLWTASIAGAGGEGEF
ncbi:mitochondrial carrier domain-containing protein [Xylaria sp. CBS 124048]|nr:mitochondrial carrier domain-containing protein [Xylaria sp. CBS 124048]